MWDQFGVLQIVSAHRVWRVCWLTEHDLSLAEQKKLPASFQCARNSWRPIDLVLQIRIYGMTYFDENAEYWGDKVHPIIGAADGRFSARSVKFFGDGSPLSTFCRNHI